RGERGAADAAAGAGQSLEAREGPQAVVRAAGEDAAVAGAALEDAGPAVGVPALDEIGDPAVREVQLPARPLVVEVKAGDVGPPAVHDGGLEGGGRRG